MTHVAVVVPGIMGSELRLGAQVIWPGGALELIRPYSKMKELLDPNLVATDVIRSFSISTQYQALVDDLETCGFQETSTPPTLVICPYDWRKDNRLAAAVLADTLDTSLQAHGGQAEFSLVCHSMGGLVGRFYLESGAFVARRAHAAVRRLITLGTPHLGAPLAITAARGDEKRLFLSAAQVKQLCSDPRYPALYQLLPRRGTPGAWDAAAGAELAPIDIYASGTVAALELVQANVTSAETFHGALDLAKRPAHVRYFFFAGTRQRTSTSARLVAFGSSFRVSPIEMDDGGDGTVPVWSGWPSGVQGLPVGGEHGTIYKNDDLRRTLATLLGAHGLLAVGAPDRVDVSIRDRVVHPNDPVHVSLTFKQAVASLEADFVFEFAHIDPATGTVQYTPVGPAIPIRYEGMQAEQMNLIVSAPSNIGIYRLALYASADPARPRIGEDDLFVQLP